jgi:hypothetical protein
MKQIFHDWNDSYEDYPECTIIRNLSGSFSGGLSMGEHLEVGDKIITIDDDGAGFTVEGEVIEIQPSPRSPGINRNFIKLDWSTRKYPE